MMKSSLLILVIAVAASLLSACGPNDRIMRSADESNSGAAQSPAAPQKDEYQREVEAMLTAELETVFSLRRKDDGAFEPEDRNIIRVNTTLANRRVMGAENNWIVIGTNNQLSDEDMKNLTDRFKITSYRRSEKPISASPTPKVSEKNGAN